MCSFAADLESAQLLWISSDVRARARETRVLLWACVGGQSHHTVSLSATSVSLANLATRKLKVEKVLRAISIRHADLRCAFQARCKTDWHPNIPRNFEPRF
jgi:hypothetical protein